MNQEVSDDNRFIKLFLSGDVMTGRGIDQALPHSVDPKLHESYVKNAKSYLSLAERHSGSIPDPISYEYLWGDALNELKKMNPDARIINLETAITSSNDYSAGKQIHYRMHPLNTSLFTKAGIDVCVLANNHTLDWGKEGLQETLEALKKGGIKTSGAGTNAKKAASPAIIQTNKGRLLIFSYAATSSGIPRSWAASVNSPGINLLQKLDKYEAETVIQNIESFRKQKDRVVFSIHWGSNWGYEIPTSQQNFAYHLLDSGRVDLIHGHSSHHPKPIEVYNGHLILYGCGDLINDYEGIAGYEQYRDDLTLMYFPVLNTEGELQSLTMIPMHIHRFRINRASKSDTQWILNQLNYECKSFGTSLEISEEGYLTLSW